MRSPLQEAAIVAWYELRAMLGARLALIVSAYGVVAMVASKLYLFVVGKIEAQLAEQGLGAEARAEALSQLSSEQFAEQFGPALSWLRVDRLFDAVLAGHIPWAVAFVLFFSSFAIGLIALVVGHDRIAGEVSVRYLRFVLLRVRRGSYLAGKILGQWLGLLAGVLLVHLGLLALAALEPLVSASEVAASLPRVWAAMALLTLAYVAFTAALSANLGRPFGVLAFGFMLMSFLWFASFFSPFRDIWMGNYDNHLWALDPVALGVFAGHALVFSGLAYAGLSRRDV